MRANVQRLIATATLAFFVFGCSVQLRTESAPSEACLMALMTGSLERHPETGLGIVDGLGGVHPVLWPFGYSARDELGRIALVDETGKIVAHEHDRVAVGGGGDNVWRACRGVQGVDNTGG